MIAATAGNVHRRPPGQEHPVMEEKAARQPGLPARRDRPNGTVDGTSAARRFPRARLFVGKRSTPSRNTPSAISLPDLSTTPSPQGDCSSARRNSLQGIPRPLAGTDSRWIIRIRGGYTGTRGALDSANRYLVITECRRKKKEAERTVSKMVPVSSYFGARGP